MLRRATVDWKWEEDKIELASCIEAMKDEIINAKGYHKNGAVAISCPQVSVAKKGFITLLPEYWKSANKEEKYKEFLHFLNPRIIQTSTQQKLQWEGCLSLPEYTKNNGIIEK